MPSKWGTKHATVCTESCAKEAEAVDNAVTVDFISSDELRDDGTETFDANEDANGVDKAISFLADVD